MPAAHSTKKRASVPSIPRSLNSKTSISTGLSSTGLFLRASSYAGRPWIFLAENAGGICLNFPVNPAARRSRTSFSKRGAVSGPEESHQRQTYRWQSQSESRIRNVSAGRHKTEPNEWPGRAREPGRRSARGSSVPRCPIWRNPRIRRTASATVVRRSACRLINNQRACVRRRKWFAGHQLFSSTRRHALSRTIKVQQRRIPPIN